MRLKFFLFFLLCGFVWADGVVIFEKSSGNIQSNMNSTTFYAFQPKETVADGNVVLGSQVYYPVDWSKFDLGSYTKAATDATNISQLVGFKAQDVLTQQSDAVVMSNKASSVITPAVKALMDCVNKRLPATNQITAVELTTATTNKIKQASVSIE